MKKHEFLKENNFPEKKFNELIPRYLERFPGLRAFKDEIRDEILIEASRMQANLIKQGLIMPAEKFPEILDDVVLSMRCNGRIQ